MPTTSTATAAGAHDLDAAWQLYTDVCEHQALDAYSPLWTLGVYPSKQDLADHIAAGDLYLLWDAGAPVAAMVLTTCEDPEYLNVPWPSGATGDDVSAIHLLAVHPAQRGRGLGHVLIREAVRIARSWGKTAIHLDVVQSNRSAARLYCDEGFAFVSTSKIWYEDTGTADFDMYELVL